MKIITVDGKEWIVKYRQNKESISNDFGTSVSNFPGFIGSKLHQNSTSSDKIAINLAVHESSIVSFKESLKKFVVDEKLAVNHSVYGKLLNIVIEHEKWGAIQGKIIGGISYNTAVNGDIPVSFTFQENTADEPQPKRDYENENALATNSVDFETSDNFTGLDISADDKTAIGRFADKLADIYKNIQNSEVVSAFNDLNSALNDAVLDSKKIMNSTKKILSLPNRIITTTTNRLTLFVDQGNEIKNLPINSLNIATFNVNCYSHNLAQTSRTVFDTPDVNTSGVRVNALT
jgi:hypothetical protein